MKNYLIGALIALAAIMLSGCEKKAVERTEQIGSWQVEKLFTVDGCSVYRFQDGRDVYFSNCPGQAQYEYSVQAGKVMSYHDLQATTSNR